MTKFVALAVLSALILAAPAYASTVSDQASDEMAIQKDNVAIAKNKATITKHRAQKAKDKATGNWAGQAVDSVAIGADHVVGTEKDGEKSADKAIQNEDSK